MDHDEAWLGRTREFLQSYDLSTQRLVELELFRASEQRPFDLIFNDLGGAETRRASLFREMAGHVAPGGLMILDDFHGPGLRRAVSRSLPSMEGFRCLSLRSFTKDSFNGTPSSSATTPLERPSAVV